jgi:hypothetical protein
MGIHRLPHGGQQPFYHVLVDERDRPGTHTTYVAQVWPAMASVLKSTLGHIRAALALLEVLLSAGGQGGRGDATAARMM